MVEIDEDKIEIRLEWAKVTNKNNLKRIYQPSAKLDEFVRQVKQHFKELENVDYLKPEETKDSPKARNAITAVPRIMCRQQIFEVKVAT